MLISLPIAALAGPLPVAVIALAWGVGAGAIALGNTWWETTLQRDIPESVYARVRSYDILVSFVFMPLGFLAFPLIARWVGLRARRCSPPRCAAALTNVVVAFLPGVRAVTEPAVAAPVTARAA